MPGEEPKDAKKTDREEREERMERLRHLLYERGEDVAKMVRTWLQRDQESKRK